MSTLTRSLAVYLFLRRSNTLTTYIITGKGILKTLKHYSSKTIHIWQCYETSNPRRVVLFRFRVYIMARGRNLSTRKGLWGTADCPIAEPTTLPPAKSYMFPMFTESPTSPTMAWHAMKVLSKAIYYLNHGQIPVMVANQPLFTLAKIITIKIPSHTVGWEHFPSDIGAHAYCKEAVGCVRELVRWQWVGYYSH